MPANPNYPPPPPNYPDGDGGQPQQNASNLFSILAIVLGGLAVIFLPIALGPAAIVLAIIGRTKGERLSTIALVVAIVGTIVGLVLSYLLFRATNT